MQTGMHAQVEEMLRECQRLAAAVERVNTAVLALTATGRSADGCVTATVGAHGEILDVSIDAAVARGLDTDTLARRVLQAADRAATQLRDETNAVLARLLPHGVHDLIRPDGTVDVQRLLPRDPGAMGGRS